MGKSIKTSKYWGVFYSNTMRGASSRMRFTTSNPWTARVKTPFKTLKKLFPSEREAAIYVDKINLEYKLGKPLNILKPKP